MLSTQPLPTICPSRAPKASSRTTRSPA